MAGALKALIIAQKAIGCAGKALIVAKKALIIHSQKGPQSCTGVSQ